MNRPRVLLVGAAGYGSLYLNEILEGNTGADLVGICDISRDLERKYPIIAEKKIPVYATLDTFFEHCEADLAIIVSPVHYHTQMVLTCFAHGANVLCEKPLCLTAQEAERMEAASRASGKFLALGYQLNYRRDVLALKEDILRGRFGAPIRLRACQSYRRGMNYYARNNWAGRIMVQGREVLDSPFANACAHYFQLMTFLLGDDMRSSCRLAKAEAELYRGNTDVENYDIAAMRFFTSNNIPILYYTAHPIKTPELGPCCVFEFEQGRIRLTPEGTSFSVEMKNGGVFDYSAIAPGAAMQKLYDAIACVRNKTMPVCGVEADYAHICAVRMAQEMPIRPVRGELRHTLQADGDTFLYIRGLEDILVNSASAWALPSEAGYSL